MSRDIRTIGDIGNTYTGLSGKTKDDFGHGDALYITFLNVLNNPIIDSSIFEKVDVKKGEKQNQCKKGDLFFNTSSETPEEVGMCAYLADDVPDLYLNSFCFGFHIKDKDIDGRYLSYYFRGKQGRKLMTMLAQGATRYNLSKENFMASEIELPMSNEQKRIATALYDIDTLIRNLDRTIEKKKNIRQGAMEQLLSGKKRLPGFKGEWEQVEIGNVCKRMKRGEVLSAAEMNTGVFPVIAAGTEPAGHCDKYNRNPMTISVSGSGANAGFVAFHKNRIFATDCFTIGASEEYDVEFIYYVLKMRQKEIFKLQTGGAQPHVYPRDLSSMSVYYTADLQEQRAIADTLTAMDDEIAVLQMERDKYANIRSGMMDDLLSGAKRI